MNLSRAAAVLMPPAVVTWTSKEPAACAGRVSLSWVSESFVNVTAVPPTVTLVTVPKSVPVTVTVLAADVGPLAGLSDDLAPAKPVDECPLVRLGLPVRCLGVDNSPQLAAHFGDNCGARRIVRSVDGFVRVGIEIK